LKVKAESSLLWSILFFVNHFSFSVHFVHPNIFTVHWLFSFNINILEFGLVNVLHLSKFRFQGVSSLHRFFFSVHLSLFTNLNWLVFNLVFLLGHFSCTLYLTLWFELSCKNNSKQDDYNDDDDVVREWGPFLDEHDAWSLDFYTHVSLVGFEVSANDTELTSPSRCLVIVYLGVHIEWTHTIHMNTVGIASGSFKIISTSVWFRTIRWSKLALFNRTICFVRVFNVHHFRGTANKFLFFNVIKRLLP